MNGLKENFINNYDDKDANKTIPMEKAVKHE